MTKECAEQLGLSGHCYWCMEAIFNSLTGIVKVEQGWINAKEQLGQSVQVLDNHVQESLTPAYYEGILVTYQRQKIDLALLINIHITSHSADKKHALRARYPSAVYTFNPQQQVQAETIIAQINQTRITNGDTEVLTQALSFNDFYLSADQQQNYYYQDPNRPFCHTRITPKLRKLVKNYGQQFLPNKLEIIKDSNNNNIS